MLALYVSGDDAREIVAVMGVMVGVVAVFCIVGLLIAVFAGGDE